MEAQLRRFWPRRKSLKKSAKPDVIEVPYVPARSGFEYNDSYEATVSGPPPQVGAFPRKPSDDKKLKKSFGHAKAQSAGLQECRTVVEKDAHLRARSTGGIQPILLGISRPITRGSMHKDRIDTGTHASAPAVPAVPRLNPTASLPSSATTRVNTVTSLPQPRKAQKFQSTNKRHVDIMSFATATGRYMEGYNEEVAERNLDLVALANESATTTSAPISRYQEDVATRNAALTGYRSKVTSRMRSVPEGGRANSLSNDVVLKSTAAIQRGYKHEGVISTSTKPMRSPHDSIAHHSRSGSGTSKTSIPLPPITQELSAEDAHRIIPGLGDNQIPDPKNQDQQGMEYEEIITRYPSLHCRNILSSGQSSSHPKSTTRANESRPIANGNLKDHVNPLFSNPYEAPGFENAETDVRRVDPSTNRLTSRHTSSGLPQHLGDSTSRIQGDAASRTSSLGNSRAASSLSNRNRTFMDLTEDEPETLSRYMSQDIDYVESPVLAQAKTDMLHVRRAQAVGSNTYTQHDMITPPDSADNGVMDTRSLRAPRPQSRRWSGAFSDSGSFSNEQSLAFSGVTIVSSMSPASRAVSKFNTVSERSRTGKSHAEPNQSSKSRRTPFSDTARPRVKEGEATHTRAGSLKTRDLGQASTSLLNSASNQGLPPTQTPQTFYTSPESLTSRDFVDPSRTSGVAARDFAATPSRWSTIHASAPRQQSQPPPAEASRLPATRQRSDPIVPHEQRTPRRHLGFEHKSSGYPSNFLELPVIKEPSKSPQLDHVDTPEKELMASSFDEEEFARKRSQARAALLRLQMSLEEQYDMSPGRPDSSAQRHVARQILDQNRPSQAEGKHAPNAPTSMYYEKKDYQSKAKTNRPAPIRTPSEDSLKSAGGYTKQGTNSFASSVYPAVTVAPSNLHIKSSSAGSASHSYNYANNTNGFNAARSSNLPNPPLTPVLPSPAGTEVSLSAFPMPTTASQSPEQIQRGQMSTAEPERPRTARKHSAKSSVASIASVYSIPHHMVPARDSSRRDQFDEKVEAW
jgi:hypothetical protein